MEALSRITEASLEQLRAAVGKRITGKRFLHTLGVEKEIAKLGEVYLPKDILRLRAAALLHDITKEKSTDEQIALCRSFSIPLQASDLLSPKILHAWTAAAVISREFPAFADPDVLDAIKKHTTGASRMSLFAKLLYLADYIEETRTFPDCVALRQAFWEPLSQLSRDRYIPHLNQILLRSFNLTISSLLEEDGVISPATVEARNALIEEISTHNS